MPPLEYILKKDNLFKFYKLIKVLIIFIHQFYFKFIELIYPIQFERINIVGHLNEIKNVKEFL